MIKIVSLGMTECTLRHIAQDWFNMTVVCLLTVYRLFSWLFQFVFVSCVFCNVFSSFHFLFQIDCSFGEFSKTYDLEIHFVV